MSLSSFKNFVKNKPNLIDYVESGKKSWQDFYNIYELYGEDDKVWSKYLNNTSNTSVTVKDLIEMIKKVDVSSMQESLSSLQKGISYISGLVAEKETNIPKRSSYDGRAMYKYFDD